MNSRRSTSAVSLLAAVLFISLLVPRLPAACARHVVLLKATDVLHNEGDADLANEPSALADATLEARKERIQLEGRKLGARDTEETEAMGAKADQKGNADTSRLKKLQAGSPMQQQQQQQVNRDAVAEMYGMLKRDYASKARRRSPINNGEPLQEEEP